MFSIKAGDLFPDLETTVRDQNNDPVDLTDATVVFSMRKAREPSSLVINAAEATIVSGTDGLIIYSWAAGETDIAGTYEGEFRVTPFAGDSFRVPTDGFLEIMVEDSIGG